MKIVKKDIRALSKEELRFFFTSNGDKAFRGNQVYEWLWQKGAHHFDDMTKGWFIGNFIPSALRTTDFEVGFVKHKKGDVWEKHYHELVNGIFKVLSPAQIEWVSLGSFRYRNSLKKIIKDYFIMCESFYTIARHGDIGKIEAVDMGRRAIHDEGAEILLQILEKYVKSDSLTARRLFTLICILHIRVTNL